MKRLFVRQASLTFLGLSLLCFSSGLAQVSPTPLSSFTTWYSILDRGNWSDPLTWNTESDGSGSSGIPGALDGVVIQAGDTVETDNANLEVSTMTLAGVLEDDNSYAGHRWGMLTGSGTLVVRETLPTFDNLSNFFSTGTVAYGGIGDYALPSFPIQYYNLSFQGSGLRTITSDLTVTHDLRVNESAVVATSTYDLTLQGNWYNTTGAAGLSGAGEVTFDNLASAQTIEGATTFHNITVSKGSQVLTMLNDITLTGSLLIISGVVDNEYTLTVGDDWTNNDSYQGLGTVVFNGLGTTHTVGGSSATAFGSLVIDGVSSTFAYNSLVSILSDLTIRRGTFTQLSPLSLPLEIPGNLTINAGGLLDATRLSRLTVNGNWTNEGTFVAGLSNVVFSSSTTQILAGETLFFGLEKANGGSLVLSDECTINGTLTLTDGYVQTSDTSVLSLGIIAGIVGGSDNSYVEGPMLHATEIGTTLPISVKLFPFGSLGKYRPATLSVGLLGAVTTVYYRGELHEGPPLARNLPGTIHHISQQRYYRISQPTVLPINLFTIEATVRIAYNTDDIVDTPSELRLAKSDGAGNWLDIGGAGTGVVGTITSTTFNSFSDFVLGSSTANNPLPVELLSLTARPHDSSVQLRWSTASETNNSHFTVERATDGSYFTPVTTIAGAGTSEEERQYEAWDHQPRKGRTYYRLRQVDFNGEHALSRPVAVDFSGVASVQVRLYPNPADERATVTLQELTVGEYVQIQLLSPDGQVVQTLQAQATHSSPLSVDIPAVSHCPPGVYSVVVASDRFRWSGQLLLKP